MAVQTAGLARYKYARQMLVKRLLVVLGALLVLAVAFVMVRNMRKPKVPNPVALTPQLSYEAEQAIDVHLIGGAVSQYAAANGELPIHLSVAPDGGVVLCGTTCNPALYEVTGFGVYEAANIKMIGYRAELEAPDPSTMYLVPGAACGNDGRVGEPSSAPRAMVILYVGTKSTGENTPRCVVL
jgi:hypothetical protein